jgi:Rod binding domain-containing protein
MTTQEIFGAGFSGLPPQEQLRKAATELEAVVLAQLLGAMRKTVPEGGFLDESVSNDIFRTMLDGELARSTAEKSPFGLADALVKAYENRIKEAQSDAEAAGRSTPQEPPDRPGRSWRI